jgi:hypothetical protein
MEPTQRHAALQAEYFHLQKTVEEFDSKAITIKAWSVTFGLVAIVGAFTSRASLVLLIASFASLLFWILETLWKTFQLGYYRRIRAIERFYRSPNREIPPLQIYADWMREWRRTPWSQVFKMAMWPHVALPHVLVVAAGTILFVLSKLGLLAL